MKNYKKETLIIYALIILLTFISNIFRAYSQYFNFFAWLLIALFSFCFYKDYSIRIKDKIGKAQTLFIVTILFIILYYLSGLFFGFEYSPYSRNLLVMFLNLVKIIFPIIFQEYVRYILINDRTNNKINIIVIDLLFIIVNISFVEMISSFNSSIHLFKYFFETFLPLCCKQILLSYLSDNCGLKAVLIYRLPIDLMFIILPIIPKLDAFLLSVIYIIYYVATYLIINNEYFEFETSIRKVKPAYFYYSFVIVILILIVNFVLGNFKYQPIAIMSNSMIPEFYRGDVVIIKKIDKKQFINLQKGDIIEYNMDNSMVIHRIINIKELDGELYFITKGDNNNAADTEAVNEKQVVGVVKLVIPKIGYPTVWLSEIFNNSKPNVEMGDV